MRAVRTFLCLPPSSPTGEDPKPGTFVPFQRALMSRVIFLGRDRPRSSLKDLPPELLLIISEHLDPVSKICLKTTHSIFYHLIDTDVNALDQCSMWLLRCRLETDMKKYPKKVACAFCKTLEYQHCFGKTGWFSTDNLRSFEALKMMEAPPTERYCAKDFWHIFRKYPRLLAPGGGQHWVLSKRLTCLHCQEPITTMFAKERTHGCNFCRCDVCPRAYLPCFTKCGWLDESKYTYIKRLKRKDGKLWVLEICGESSIL